MSFRNDTPGPVVVQASAVVQGKVCRDRPSLLQRGDVARVNLPGNKLICIYDARLPSRVLFQTTLPASPMERLFAILPAPESGKVRLEPIDPQVAGKR